MNTQLMRVYHRTTAEAAADIRIMGFCDAVGSYGTTDKHVGVCVSDVPLDANEGAEGDVLLTLKIPGDLFLQYEWLEEGTNWLACAVTLYFYRKVLERSVSGRVYVRVIAPGNRI